MERYETACIEIAYFEDDVITASVMEGEFYNVNSSDTPNSTGPARYGWTVYYSDGEVQDFPGGDKPEICP